MRRIHNLFLLAVMGIITACAPVRTAFDYDKQANFAQYKTFAFYKEGIDQLKVNDIDKKRLVSATLASLEDKGLKINKENPDLLVNIVITGKDRVNFSEDYPYGYGWWYAPPSVTVRQYTENTIYIDLIDKAKNQLVWQGKGTGEFNAGVQNKDELIFKAISEILKQYPYGRK